MLTPVQQLQQTLGPYARRAHVPAPARDGTVGTLTRQVLIRALLWIQARALEGSFAPDAAGVALLQRYLVTGPTTFAQITWDVRALTALLESARAARFYDFTAFAVSPVLGLALRRRRRVSA